MLDPENAARKHKPSPMITGCLFRSSNKTLHDCAAGSPVETHSIVSSSSSSSEL